MADTVLHITGVVTDTPTKKYGRTVYKEKNYPVGQILYTAKADLPDHLSRNALIFTVDTAELFVGTGDGITRLKLGTEEDINPRIYLKIAEAVANYQNKDAAAEDKEELVNLLKELEDKVYSKDEIDEFLTKDVDLDGVLDRVNTYTLDKINELLAEKAESVDVYTQDQIDTQLEAIDEKITYNKNETDDAITNLTDNVNTDIANLDQKIEEVRSDADTEDTNIKNIIDDVKTDIEDFKAQVSDQDTANEDQFRDITDRVSDLEDKAETFAIAEDTDASLALKADQDTVDQALATKVDQDTYEAGITEVKDLIGGTIRGTKYVRNGDSVNDNLTALDQAVRAEAENAATELGNAKSELEDKIKEISDYAKNVNTNAAYAIKVAEKKADADSVYTKAEVDEIIANVLTSITNLLKGDA